MKSVRTKIIEAIVTDLKTIKAGMRPTALPISSTEVFSTTLKLVSRALSDVPLTSLPAVFVTDPSVAERQLLSDLSLATMQVYISGLVHSLDDKHPAVEYLDLVYDDVCTVLKLNPTWNGLARRSRVVRSEHNPEVEEPDASFSIVYEVDYIEAVPVSGYPPVVLVPLPTGEDLPVAQAIMNTLHNAFQTTEEIVRVAEADVWPVPPEQVSQQQCPAIHYQAIEELYEYHASTLATKRVTVATELLAVDLDPETFTSSIDTWLSRFKNVIGTYADLLGRVNAVDIRSIRTSRSEFPLIRVEADLVVRYMQSFLSS